jgi:LytR cell envelope-related transcriptional attenuator
VEHAYALSNSRWRTATLVASVIATLELVVLGVIGFSALARTVQRDVHNAAVNKVAGPSPVQHRAEQGRPLLPRDETGVLVLNGNGVAGAAAESADHLRRLGYLVSGVGNADATVATRTLVMYRGKFRAEALRLARDMHARLVTPLDGMKPSDLMGAQLAVVLGS